MDCIKEQPSTLGLCSDFPSGEYFLQRKESLSTSLLPVNVSNINSDEPVATKEAHYQRLKKDLPDPVSFGHGFTEFGLKGCATHLIVTKGEVSAATALREAEERRLKEAEIALKLAAEEKARAAAARAAEKRRRHRQAKIDERNRLR